MTLRFEKLINTMENYLKVSVYKGVEIPVNLIVILQKALCLVLANIKKQLK